MMGEMLAGILYLHQWISKQFEMEFTWKIATGGNSGVFYHVVEDPKYAAPYYTGPEYQVIDQLGISLSLWKIGSHWEQIMRCTSLISKEW
jgi:hypothetical protein